jgi:hypothetical protein
MKLYKQFDHDVKKPREMIIDMETNCLDLTKKFIDELHENGFYVDVPNPDDVFLNPYLCIDWSEEKMKMPRKTLVDLYRDMCQIQSKIRSEIIAMLEDVCYDQLIGKILDGIEPEKDILIHCNSEHYQKALDPSGLGDSMFKKTIYFIKMENIIKRINMDGFKIQQHYYSDDTMMLRLHNDSHSESSASD